MSFRRFVEQPVGCAPVVTLVATIGEACSQACAIVALVAEWEFNLPLTHYYDDPRDGNGEYTATNLYLKHRFHLSGEPLVRNERRDPGDWAEEVLAKFTVSAAEIVSSISIAVWRRRPGENAWKRMPGSARGRHSRREPQKGLRV